MPEFILQIDGMHCGACVRRVTEALKSVEGAVVNEVRVGAARSLSTGTLRPSILPLPPLPKPDSRRVWKPDSTHASACDRIHHAACSGDDLRLLPASCGRGSALHGRSQNRTR